MCEAHNHAAEETTETVTEAAGHDHASHDHTAHDHGTDQGAHQHGADAVESETAECPVMRGNFVDKADAEAAGLVREHEGTKYYLCCAACGPLFDADPAKYVGAAA